MLNRSVLAARHLELRLRPLARVLASAVERQARAAGKLHRPDVTPLCVSDQQVKMLLEEIESARTLGRKTTRSAQPNVSCAAPPRVTAFGCLWTNCAIA